MAQSQLALYNMALSACGADYSLATVDEQSIPAEVCELWYENTRQTVLRAAFWTSCKRHIRLTKQASRDSETGYDSDTDADWQNSDPEPGFAFSYDLPASMLIARYLTDFSQFSIGYENEGTQKILSCNIGGPTADDAPILCYTVDVTDVTLWEPDMYQAVIYGLAANICMPLTGKMRKAEALFSLANQIMREAQARSANEMHQMLVQVPRRLQARGYSYDAMSPFIYPYGNLFTNAGAAVT